MLNRLLRGRLRPAMPEEPIYLTIALKNIDPIVQMGTLEELLTGRTFEEILDVDGDVVVALRDGGERLVVRLTSELSDALARIPVEKSASVGEAWSRTEEFGGLVPPQALAGIVQDLADLARHAAATDERLYCWLSV